MKDKPDYADARFWLAQALESLGRLDEAIVASREHLRLSPDSPGRHLHLHLGGLLYQQGRLDDAIASSRKAVEVDPKDRFAEWYLATLLRVQKIQGKLPAFLKGEYQPKDNSERELLADLCRMKKLYHTGARLYAEAFASDPKLGDNPQDDIRRIAARQAAMAGVGQGEDAAKLDDTERARLRRQAQGWLRADLGKLARQVESGKDADRLVVKRTLQDWQNDGDLAGIRDEAALAKLPEAERKEWQGLWGDVKALLEKAQKKTP